MRISDWSSDVCSSDLSLVSGSLGMWCGPFIGRMLARRGYDDATMRGVVCAIGLCPLFAFALPFAATPTIALVLLFGLSFSYTLPLTLSSSALPEATGRASSRGRVCQYE